MKWLLSLLIFSCSLFAEEIGLKDLVLTTKEIKIPGAPGAFNPSIVPWKNHYLLTFRYSPNLNQAWISQIGVALLNENFDLIGSPQILNTRPNKGITPSQAEDARIIENNGQLYLIYNDCVDIINPAGEQRRDMYVAKLDYVNQKFVFSSPLKLTHGSHHINRFWEKNWVPFVYGGKLLLGYTIVPHQVLDPNYSTGICLPLSTTYALHSWKWGHLRGGTPAQLVDGEYFAFFHSSIPLGPWHSRKIRYYMGAYAFQSTPPFKITKMTMEPIIEKKFYEPCHYHKEVVFPGGYIEKGPYFYVVYGKDDSEIWVATIDKERLKRSMKPVVNR